MILKQAADAEGLRDPAAGESARIFGPLQTNVGLFSLGPCAVYNEMTTLSDNFQVEILPLILLRQRLIFLSLFKIPSNSIILPGPDSSMIKESDYEQQ